MANNFKRGLAALNEECNRVGALLNSGKLRIYDGTQPATPDTAITSQVLLAELTFNATAVSSASAGAVAFNAITQDSSADATGNATWFRAVKSDGTTAVFDGSVGTSGCDLNINNVAIQATGVVSVSSMTYTATQ